MFRRAAQTATQFGCGNLWHQRMHNAARDIILEIDGGLNAETAPKAIAAGATAIVAGSAVFQGGPSSYAENIRVLRPKVRA